MGLSVQFVTVDAVATVRAKVWAARALPLGLPVEASTEKRVRVTLKAPLVVWMDEN